MHIPWYSYLALMISLFQFTLLFNSIGHVVPVRYTLGSFMCLQFYVGPTFAYAGLDKFQRGFLKMQIPESEYFSYALPAVICFIIGLHLRAKSLEGERLNIEGIRIFVRRNPNLAYWFIGIGFSASFLGTLFGAAFAFVFALLANLKFVGAFMLILGGQKIRLIVMSIVFGSIILSSFAKAMFHDLLTWTIFIGAVFSIKYKPTTQTKAVFTTFFILAALTIQLLKGGYRQATWYEGQEAGLETLQKTIEEEEQKRGSFFNTEKLGASNVRINQGFIITNIMKTVPERVPHARGEQLLQILEAAFLPRLLAPNKLNAGDKQIFTKYSGMPLGRGTSMGLSAMGDGYINYGKLGGCIFMLVLGLLYSETLKIFYKYSKYYPGLLLFMGVVFYYPIRPDCELQTALGHLVKSSFLLFVMIQVWKFAFYVRPSIKQSISNNELRH